MWSAIVTHGWSVLKLDSNVSAVVATINREVGRKVGR